MKLRVASFALIAAFIPSASALADGRTPKPEEQTAIEGALKAEGFTAWGKIDLDEQGHWDVDNAIGSDGKKYDVHLSVADLKVVKKEIDHD